MTAAGREGSHALESDLARLNGLDAELAEAELLRVCGSRAWARAVAARRPIADPGSLLAAAEDAWEALEVADWREAFAAHPRIGENATLDGAPASAWSVEEQSRATQSEAETRAELADAQRRYEERFGHGFLISAAGKSAEQILGACVERLAHDPGAELWIGAAEERKIGRLRLKKLLATGR